MKKKIRLLMGITKTASNSVDLVKMTKSRGKRVVKGRGWAGLYKPNMSGIKTNKLR